jgi:hypothetical protein
MSSKYLPYTPVSSIRLELPIKAKVKKLARAHKTNFSGMVRILLEEAIAARSN